MTDERYEKLSQELGSALSSMYLAKATMERLESENARLREALKQIADQNINPWCATVARAALEGKE